MLWHKAKHLKNHMTVSAKRRTYLSVRILLHQIADIAVGKMKILLKIFKCSRRSCRDASAHQIEMLVPVGNALHAHPVGTPSGDVTLHFGAHLLHHAVEDLEKFFLGKLRAKKFNIALDELRLPCFVLFQPDEHVEVGQRSVMGRNAFRGEICGKQVSLSAGRLLESEIQIEKEKQKRTKLLQFNLDNKISDEDFLTMSAEIKANIADMTAKVEELTKKKQDNAELRERLARMKKMMESASRIMSPDDITPAVMDAIVDKIEVTTIDETHIQLDVFLNDGSSKTTAMYKENRGPGRPKKLLPLVADG